MKKKLRLSLIGAILFAGALSIDAIANPIVLVDFTNPDKHLQSGDALPRTLGGSGTYSFGTWVHSAVGEIDVGGSGFARIRNNAANNPRAISVIFDGSLFTAGTEYTVSFDQLGNVTGDNTGRYWLAEVGGYGPSGTIVTNVAQGSTWALAARPFTATGAGTINFLADSPSNGVLLEGENLAGTTATSFNFTYTAGTDIAFAVGTYNHIFSIDNFKIEAIATPIPEPSTYVLLLGGGAFGLVLYRRRRTR